MSKTFYNGLASAVALRFRCFLGAPPSQKKKSRHRDGGVVTVVVAVFLNVKLYLSLFYCLHRAKHLNAYPSGMHNTLLRHVLSDTYVSRNSGRS